MPKQSIGPEARIIQLFGELSDDSKRIVLDVIRTQAVMAKPRKKADPKPTAAPKQAEQKETKEAICGTCGNVKAHADHDRRYLKSHDFVPAGSGKKRKPKADTLTLAEVPSEPAALAVGAD